MQCFSVPAGRLTDCFIACTTQNHIHQHLQYCIPAMCDKLITVHSRLPHRQPSPSPSMTHLGRTNTEATHSGQAVAHTGTNHLSLQPVCNTQALIKLLSTQTHLLTWLHILHHNIQHPNPQCCTTPGIGRHHTFLAITQPELHHMDEGGGIMMCEMSQPSQVHNYGTIAQAYTTREHWPLWWCIP